MASNKKIIKDRIATTDAHGQRVKIFPAEVKGIWNTRRSWFHWVLIIFYLILPWLSISGHPVLLLDIVHRRFSIMGQLFFAQDAPNLFLIAISFILFIVLFTSLFGRVWCGWACPQTVFVERIFRQIEIWFEGDFIQRKALDASDWNFNKIWRRVSKNSSYIIVSVIIAHSFLAYFVGAQNSYHLLLTSPSENLTLFIVAMVMMGVVLFDFGWFREQFCLIACPYGRFQSVMQDESTKVISYDTNRSDCIDCYKCVRVCPTGIDIRNGQQMECIGCTACMDACDSVMAKIKKPLELISYKSIDELKGKKFKIVRPRTLIYSSLLLLVLIILSLRLSMRNQWQTDLVRAIDTPYQMIKDVDGTKWYINHLKIAYSNMNWSKAEVSFDLTEESKAKNIQIIKGGEDSGVQTLESSQKMDRQFFIKFPASLVSGDELSHAEIRIRWFIDSKLVFEETKEIGLLGSKFGI